ncbi:hypothetical protein BDR04DRAFT_752234 [Suillus decipiens]|nr:hypothetical protein BDR04DRAFT_752234 [Suillus decipiens]
MLLRAGFWMTASGLPNVVSAFYRSTPILLTSQEGVLSSCCVSGFLTRFGLNLKRVAHTFSSRPFTHNLSLPYTSSPSAYTYISSFPLTFLQSQQVPNTSSLACFCIHQHRLLSPKCLEAGPAPYAQPPAQI